MLEFMNKQYMPPKERGIWHALVCQAESNSMPPVPSLITLMARIAQFCNGITNCDASGILNDTGYLLTIQFNKLEEVQY